MSSSSAGPATPRSDATDSSAHAIVADLVVERPGFRLEAAFEVPAQGFVGLVGPSGSGKTTLLRALAGLEPGSVGEFRMGDVVWQSESRFVPPHRRGLGYVFQEPSLFTHLNVRANLDYGFRRRSPGRRRVKPEDAITILGVGKLLERRVNSLSGGERQRVAIARAILASPDLLLMDEPLAALDDESKRELLPYLESMHRSLSIPVLYVSHAIDELARLSDHLIMLDDGKIVAVGETNDLMTRVDLPIARGEDAASVLEATVVEHDASYQLTYLEFPGGRLALAHRDLEVGQRVRVRLMARDISLTLKQQSDTSILNILPATVESVSEQGAQVVVRLSISGSAILSRITRKSAAALGLAPGSGVYAQIKSVAIL